MVVHPTDLMSTHANTIAPAIQLALNAMISSVYTVVQRHIVATTVNGEPQYHVVEVSMKSELECTANHASTKAV